MPNSALTVADSRPSVFILTDQSFDNHTPLNKCLSADFDPVWIDDDKTLVIRTGHFGGTIYLVDYDFNHGAGVAAARDIRKRNRNAKIILMAGPGEISKAKRASGIDHFLPKPFTDNDLLRVLRHFSGEKSSPASGSSNPAPAKKSGELHRSSKADKRNRPVKPTSSIGDKPVVEGHASDGSPFHGDILRIDSYTVSCQITHPNIAFPDGQMLTGLSLALGGTQVYEGDARVLSSVREERGLVCEFSLTADGWLIGKSGNEPVPVEPSALQSRITSRLNGVSLISDQFKLVVADLAAALKCIDQSLAPAEFQLQRLEPAERQQFETRVVTHLVENLTTNIDEVVARFESIANEVPQELETLHMDYTRDILHPLVLSSPLIHRSYSKPLGIPGDYGILAMLTENPQEGMTLFAKFINAWLIGTPAGAAYRHRMRLMVANLVEASKAAFSRGHRAEMLSLGCGAAREVQEFFKNHNIAFNSSFTLIDFDERTLAVAAEQIEQSRTVNRCQASVRLIRQSVNEFIDASRSHTNAVDGRQRDHLKPNYYDHVYCMGLFDYFSDRFCKRLIRIFCDITAPGGKITICNFSPGNPINQFMRYLLDWKLKHRDVEDMLGLVPDDIPEGDRNVTTSDDRVECYLHIRKPNV